MIADFGIILTMKTKLTYLSDHDTRLVYLNGKESDIQYDWLLLFNHGATDEELEWIFEDRACFYTNETKLRKGLESIYYHRLLQEGDECVAKGEKNPYKGLKGGIMPYVKGLAKMTFDKMERESATPIYLAINRPYKDLSAYGMGTITTPNEKSFTNGE